MRASNILCKYKSCMVSAMQVCTFRWATGAAAGRASTKMWPAILPMRSRCAGSKRCSAAGRRLSRARAREPYYAQRRSHSR